ncbi:VWA domain-containing protein [Leptolyngbya sp. 7M]|uniref:VWA domain-containing protein n=1 Tax=Leptolyngbya sp. 7M TaxID=2812896 RepID=UPI001B8D78DD|nr:VWA domain-containing protein [Leptolyngbya sp. 7M]QYO66895.1 VWA domain-containing protein [Leptolyngbya sp. 7M]
MKRFLHLSVFLLLAATLAFSQSGRRVEPQPTPTPAAVELYSETVPLPKRPPRVSPRFRSVGADNIPSTRSNNSDGSVGDVEDIEDVVRVATNLVTIPVSVFDRNGFYIPGLRKENFKIFDNGVEQEIEYFATTEQAFTVVLMIDTSPSTQYKIEEIRNAARAFVDQLKPQDRVAVIEFNGSIKVRTEATTNRTAIYNAIRKTNWGGGTSLYDAVDLAFRRHIATIEGRKAVVIFTDGVDTTSRRATYDSTLDLAEELDALVFAVYYNTFYETARSMPQSWPFPGRTQTGRGTTSGEYAVGRKYIEELTAYTGGRMFRPEATPGGLERAFEAIAEELRRQYDIGFIPSEDGSPGERRQIRVRVDRPNLVVRSRDSYIVAKK